VVSTLAGSSQGYLDATGTKAQFDYPSGVAVDSSGILYVADTDNHRIRKIPSDRGVTTLAGSTQGYEEGTGTAAKFRSPSGVAVFGTGDARRIYVADWGNHLIRRITISPAGVVTVSRFAGSATQAAGDDDGDGLTEAQFAGPIGVAVDSDGNVYVADYGNHRIRKITPEGVVITIAGSSKGYKEGTGTAARFDTPQGVAVDSKGNVYVADSSNHRIRKITPERVVTTIAGSSKGYKEGTGTAAQFDNPMGMAVDSDGILYVVDNNNHRIRKIEYK